MTLSVMYSNGSFPDKIEREREREGVENGYPETRVDEEAAEPSARRRRTEILQTIRNRTEANPKAT